MDLLKHTRKLKRLENGTYTISPKTVLSNNADLCTICGIKEKCPIYEARCRLLASGADFQLNTCLRYVPLIIFRKPLIGLQEPYFNTLRAGVTWRNRVSEGSVVALVESDTGKRIRFAKVARVASGTVNDMLRCHSRFNHLCMGGMPQSKVREVIKKSYGRFLKEDSQLTAIYLRSLRYEYDWQYHSEEELEVLQPAPAKVIDILSFRKK